MSLLTYFCFIHFYFKTFELNKTSVDRISLESFISYSRSIGIGVLRLRTWPAVTFKPKALEHIRLQQRFSGFLLEATLWAQWYVSGKIEMKGR